MSELNVGERPQADDRDLAGVVVPRQKKRLSAMREANGRMTTRLPGDYCVKAESEHLVVRLGARGLVGKGGGSYACSNGLGWSSPALSRTCRRCRCCACYSHNGGRGGEMARLSNVYGDKHDDHLHRKGDGRSPTLQQPARGDPVLLKLVLRSTLGTCVSTRSETRCTASLTVPCRGLITGIPSASRTARRSRCRPLHQTCRNQ